LNNEEPGFRQLGVKDSEFFKYLQISENLQNKLNLGRVHQKLLFTPGSFIKNLNLTNLVGVPFDLFLFKKDLEAENSIEIVIDQFGH
jgi:hypothetical protein